MGNDVRSAYNAVDALDAGRTFLPDVVLLDIGLPEMNGYDAARRIRTESWGKKTVLIAVTGWGQPEDRRRSREAGFDHHIVKPVAVATLLELLASTRSSPPRSGTVGSHRAPVVQPSSTA